MKRNVGLYHALLQIFSTQCKLVFLLMFSIQTCKNVLKGLFKAYILFVKPNVSFRTSSGSKVYFRL